MNLKCDVCHARFSPIKRVAFGYYYNTKGIEVVFCTDYCKKKLSNMPKMTPIREALVP